MTFGAPKVTDAPGAQLLHGILPVLRVTHERDPVPLMPLVNWAAAQSIKYYDQEGQERGTITSAEKAIAGTTVASGIPVLKSTNAKSRVDMEEGSGSPGSIGGCVGGSSRPGRGGAGRSAKESRSSAPYSHFGSQVGEGEAGQDKHIYTHKVQSIDAVLLVKLSSVIGAYSAPPSPAPPHSYRFIYFNRITHEARFYLYMRAKIKAPYST